MVRVSHLFLRMLMTPLRMAREIYFAIESFSLRHLKDKSQSTATSLSAWFIPSPSSTMASTTRRTCATTAAEDVDSAVMSDVATSICAAVIRMMSLSNQSRHWIPPIAFNAPNPIQCNRVQPYKDASNGQPKQPQTRTQNHVSKACYDDIHKGLIHCRVLWFSVAATTSDVTLFLVVTFVVWRISWQVVACRFVNR